MTAFPEDSSWDVEPFRYFIDKDFVLSAGFAAERSNRLS